jgi:hypothetical protein
MDLSSSQSFFWLCFGISIFAVSAFICWAIFEFARMLRQGNEVVEHARDVVGGIEEDVTAARAKLGGVLGNMAGIASAVKGIASMKNAFDGGEEKPAKKSKKRFNKLLNEEEEVPSS